MQEYMLWARTKKQSVQAHWFVLHSEKNTYFTQNVNFHIVNTGSGNGLLPDGTKPLS